MRTFIGNIDAKMDEKGRVFIPAGYRKILGEARSMRMVARRDAEQGCILFYPEEVWNARLEQLSQVLDDWNPDDDRILMQYVGEAELLDPDMQGRVLLSKKNTEYLNGKSDLVFVGMLDKFALWSREQYEQQRIEPRELAKLIRERMIVESQKSKVESRSASGVKNA